MIRVSSVAVVLTFGVACILSGLRGVGAQFVDGGTVAMSCDLCICQGSASDGTDVVVFENPSSGNLVRKR